MVFLQMQVSSAVQDCRSRKYTSWVWVFLKCTFSLIRKSLYVLSASFDHVSSSVLWTVRDACCWPCWLWPPRLDELDLGSLVLPWLSSLDRTKALFVFVSSSRFQRFSDRKTSFLFWNRNEKVAFGASIAPSRHTYSLLPLCRLPYFTLWEKSKQTFGKFLRPCRKKIRIIRTRSVAVNLLIWDLSWPLRVSEIVLHDIC